MTRGLAAIACATALLLPAGARAAAPEAPPSEGDRGGWLAPDFARLQTGGRLGMITVGVGWSALRDVINVGATYGWVPPRHGAAAANLGSLAVTLRPLRFGDEGLRAHPLYFGGGVFIGHNVMSRPAAVEEAPFALWGLFVVGAEISVREARGGWILRHGFFVEEVALGPHVAALVRNEGMHLLEAFSTAIGYRAAF